MDEKRASVLEYSHLVARAAGRHGVPGVCSLCGGCPDGGPGVHLCVARRSVGLWVDHCGVDLRRSAWRSGSDGGFIRVPTQEQSAAGSRRYVDGPGMSRSRLVVRPAPPRKKGCRRMEPRFTRSERVWLRWYVPISQLLFLALAVNVDLIRRDGLAWLVATNTIAYLGLFLGIVAFAVARDQRQEEGNAERRVRRCRRIASRRETVGAWDIGTCPLSRPACAPCVATARFLMAWVLCILL